METQTWFEIEYSYPGENDWYQSGMGTFDALELAREIIREGQDEGFDYRVVKVIHTREAL